MSRSMRRSVVLRAFALALSFVVAISLVACSSTAKKSSSTTKTPAKTQKLVLASTTSTQDSGLFSVLIPAFEKAYPRYKVNVIAVGTGEALTLGQKKDADVLLVHAKKKELDFVAKGYGVDRRDVMYNDFIIVGPSSDPAKIKGSATAADAFKKIATAKATFISRGDDSGTNTKELGIWDTLGIKPTGSWYKAAGQGMGQVLTMASEQGAYTFTDRGTYLSMKDQLKLDILVEGGKDLLNQYGVIRIPGASNEQGAKDFENWITSAAGQRIIKDFGLAKYGISLFNPDATGTAQ